MKRLVEFPLEDGNFIIVEVELSESESGTARAGRETETPLRAHQTFESALKKVKPVAEAVISSLHSVTERTRGNRS